MKRMIILFNIFIILFYTFPSHAEFHSRIAGFVEVEIDENETKPVGNVFDSFDKQSLAQMLAGNCDENDRLHVWVGSNFNTYELHDGEWKIINSDSEIPIARIADEKGTGYWLTRHNPGDISAVISGYITEENEIKLPANSWRLIYYRHPDSNLHPLNAIGWGGANNGDQLKVFNGNDWVNYVYNSGEWTGPDTDAVGLSIGDPILYKNNTSEDKTLKIEPPQIKTKDGESVAEVAAGDDETSGGLWLTLEGMTIPETGTSGNSPEQQLDQIDLLVYDEEMTLLRSVPLNSLDNIVNTSTFNGVINLGANTANGTVSLQVATKDRSHTAYIGEANTAANAFLPVPMEKRLVNTHLNWVQADVDLDNLTDEWEQSHFSNLQEADGTSDPDYDGLSNREEQDMGSDPKRQSLWLNPGWNLIAISNNPNPGQTIKDQLGEDTYDGNIWYWNGKHYETVSSDSTLVPTNGYWVYCSTEQNIELPAGPEGDGHRVLNSNWNLVGCIRGGTLHKSESITTPLWSFKQGQYVEANLYDLRPMTGYWLHSNISQDMDLP